MKRKNFAKLLDLPEQMGMPDAEPDKEESSPTPKSGLQKGVKPPSMGAMKSEPKMNEPNMGRAPVGASKTKGRRDWGSLMKKKNVGM